MKLLARVVLGLTLVGAVGLMPVEVAAQIPANEAAERCRALDEAGVLEDAGVTRGECVNILKQPSSENANNFIAGRCGLDIVQAALGVENKGQCIKLLKG